MAASDAWQSFLERLLQGTLTDEDRVRLRRVLLISGQGNVLQVGKYNINIGQGENIQIGDRVYQGPDLETLRRVVREVQANIAADRYAASLQAYFAALREYCRNLPYLTLYDIRPPKKLDEVYVPLQLRERRPEHEPGSKGDETQRFPAPPPDTLSIAEVLQQARKSHLLILGEPGAGKSTLLRRLAEQAWDNHQAIGLERPCLPMLIPLRTLAAKGGALDRRLTAALGDELPLGEDLPEGFFRAWAQQMDAPWLLLLDGLDEVPEDRRTGLLQWLDGILPLVGDGRVIITARPSVYDPRECEYKPFNIYEIQPFTPEQTRALAEKWLGDEAPAFLSALENVRAADLNGTPLLLTIAAKVYLRRKEETGVGSLPERRSKLYEEFIDETLLKEAKTRGLGVELGDDVADLAKPALARLALAMTEHPDWTDEERLAQVAAEYLGEAMGLKRDLAEAKGRRFVQVMGRRSGVLLRHGGTYEWLHPTFREYLVAWWLVKEYEQDLWKIFNSTAFQLEYKSWSEVAVFVLACLTDSGQDVSNLALAYMTLNEPGIYVAGFSLAEHSNISQDVANVIIDALLIAAKKGIPESFHVLSLLTDYEVVIQGLCELVVNRELAKGVRLTAIRTLKNHEALFVLIHKQELELDLRMSSALELGRIGFASAAKTFLLSVARSESDMLVAARILSELGFTTDAKSILFDLIQSANSELHLLALVFLMAKGWTDWEASCTHFTDLMQQVGKRLQESAIEFLVREDPTCLQKLTTLVWNAKFSIDVRSKIVYLAYENRNFELILEIIRNAEKVPLLASRALKLLERSNDLNLLESLSVDDTLEIWIRGEVQSALQIVRCKIACIKRALEILDGVVDVSTRRALNRPDDIELIREVRLLVLEDKRVGNFRRFLLETLEFFPDFSFDRDFPYYLPLLDSLSNDDSDISIRHAAHEAIARIRQHLAQSGSERGEE